MEISHRATVVAWGHSRGPSGQGHRGHYQTSLPRMGAWEALLSRVCLGSSTSGSLPEGHTSPLGSQVPTPWAQVLGQLICVTSAGHLKDQAPCQPVLLCLLGRSARSRSPAAGCWLLLLCCTGCQQGPVPFQTSAGWPLLAGHGCSSQLLSAEQHQRSLNLHQASALSTLLGGNARSGARSARLNLALAAQSKSHQSLAGRIWSL